MGWRQITVKESVAESIAEIAWYIESKGHVLAAEAFTDEVYDFLLKMSDSRRTHAICRDPSRALLGFKCIPFKKKYTIIFLETIDEIVVCEFLPSKNIHW